MEDLGQSATDVVLDSARLEDAGRAIVRHLASKGFCLVDLGLQAQLLEQALRDVQPLDSLGRLQRPPAELLPGLLGAYGSARVAELALPRAAGAAWEVGPSLLQLDATLAQVGRLIAEPAAVELGLLLTSRTSGLVHEACSAGGGAHGAVPALDEDTCSRWFTTLSQHRVMCVLLLGPGSACLQLRPLDGVSNPLDMEMQPGALALLRADALSHELSPRSAQPVYSLTCFCQEDPASTGSARTRPLTPCATGLQEWALRRLEQVRAEEEQGGEFDPSAPRALPARWQAMVDHFAHSGRGRLAVVGAAARLPTAWEPELWLSTLSVGPDFATGIPLERWAHDDWFDPDPDCWQARKTSCKHAAFTEGVDLFDNKFFTISATEAEFMDPRQRHLLEVGYEALRRSGYSKGTLMRCHGGVYVAAVNQNEWGSLQSKVTAHAATGRAASIMAGRMSYALGLKGPSLSLDVGGCGLCGVHLGAEAARPRTDGGVANEFSACLGAAVLLSACNWWQWQAAGLLSRSGRCRPFDVSADGYVPGEGAVAAVLRRPAEVVDDGLVAIEGESLGSLAGTALNHNGGGASLYAPSGAAERELLLDAARAAGIAARSVDCLEADGRSTPIGDAVELLACASSLCDAERAAPLAVGCTKPNCGNVDAAVGLVGLLKSLAVAAGGSQPPTAHLRELSPLLDELVEHPVCLATEALAVRRPSAFVGATSYGFGMNAHALAFGVDRLLGGAPPLADGLDLRRSAPRSRPAPLAFWPAGGGELPPAERPDQGYFVKGSWSCWDEAELMEEEGGGTFGATVVLGDSLSESFQIWLDGDPERALFPSHTWEGAAAPVCGPGASHEGGCWLIDCSAPSAAGAARDRPAGAAAAQAAEEEGEGELAAAAPAGREGRPGDQYRIRLEVHGRWRRVDWHLLPCGNILDFLGVQPPQLGSEPTPRREFDIVLYGATGFTGRLCAHYLAGLLASSAEPWVRSFRVALAGRSGGKLAAVQRDCSPGWSVIVVEADDLGGLLELAQSTHVCLSAAGPFMKYSRNLVHACCKSGTDYADINGEAPFVRHIIDRCHVDAEASGAMVVPNCGFDCVPSDMGCFAALQVLERTHRRRFPSSPVTVRAYMDVRGVVSGGTIASGIMVAEDPALEALAADPFVLGGENGANPRVSHEDAKEATFDDRLLCWTAPLEMSRVNSRVVRRSQHLFREDLGCGSPSNGHPYPAVFTYREVAVAPSEAVARRLAAPTPSPEERRRMVEAGQLPAPGEGPDAKTRARSTFEVKHVAECDDDPDASRVCVAVGGRDPGYEETSKMAVQAAVTLALRHYGCYPEGTIGRGRSGGVLTPAFALGIPYLRRLHLAGIAFRQVNLRDEGL